jgi:prepilin-type N-terminal cleavage/methylation domain-containing protein
MNSDRKPFLLPRRAGFTLIELMVTMAIMATLTAAMAYVMAGAQEAAQIAKTRTLIARLHTLVMQKYESYRNRRLPITMPGEVIDPTSGKTIPTPLAVSQTVRCDVIRQLMRMEMPERWTDLDDPAPVPVADGHFNPPLKYKDVANPTQFAFVYMAPPSVLQAYRGQAGAIPRSNSPIVYTPGAADSLFEGAKCLYLLVTMGLDEQDVMENFSEGDIADFDHSGHKVFLDAWGKPIGFLRWAPAFISPLQPLIVPPQRDIRMADQTDPTGVYGTPGNKNPHKQTTFSLYPLIYSAGPDGYIDMISKSKAIFHYSQTQPLNDPFVSLTDTANFPVGGIGAAAIFDDQGNYQPFDSGSTTYSSAAGRSLGNTDNIHNHTIGAR